MAEDGNPVDSGTAALSLWLIRSDLAYIATAMSADPKSALIMLPHGVLVSYEASVHLSRSPLHPDARAPGQLAERPRNRAKLLDDRYLSAADLAAEFGPIAAEWSRYFRGGRRRQLARRLGLANPDVSVTLIGQQPVAFNLGLAYLCGWNADSAQAESLGTFAHDLAYGVGRLAGQVDVALQGHTFTPIEYRDMDATWSDLHPLACAGTAEPAVVAALFLLLCQANSALLWPSADCCEGCRAASFKRRFLIAYQVQRSLLGLQKSGKFASLAESRALAESYATPSVERIRSWRRLRNGLTHFGLNDLPMDRGTEPGGLRTLIDAYCNGESFETADAVVSDALGVLARGLAQVADAQAAGAPSWRSALITP
jgi:hypothetical protein